MDRKGLLNDAQENWCADVIFHKVQFPNKIAKWVSRPVILWIIRMIDNLVLNRIKPELKAVIIPFINAGMNLKIEEMRRLATDLGAMQLDLKYVSKDTELYMVDSWTRVLVSHGLAFVEYQEGKRAA